MSAAMVGEGAVRPEASRPEAVRERPRFDVVLLAAVLLLMALGVVMVYSASAMMAAAKQGDGFYFARRQLLFVAVGIGAMALMLRVGYRRLEDWALPLLAVSFGLVILTLLPGLGLRMNGAQRWLRLPGLQLQPTEFAKLALCAYLARSVTLKGGSELRTLTVGVAPHFFVVGLLSSVVLLQPDFGTVMVMFAVTLAVLFVAGAPMRHVMLVLVGALPAVWWLVSSSAYRMRRIQAFLDPFSDRFGKGYQVVESMISVGSGGLTGKGLGSGPQKLGYLPEGHTDYILASVGEELGLLGIALVLGLLWVVIWRGLRAARLASDPFGCYLAYGITALIAIEAMVNAGMCLGLLPSKGLALPFVSYGGTSIVKMALAAGVLLSVSEGRGGYMVPVGAER